MTRRDFLAAGAALAAAPVFGQEPDLKLRLAPLTLELAPKRSVKTVAYNGQVPGPVVRWKEGQQVTVEVTNANNAPDLVHWHGFHIPPEVDGSMEEGTAMTEPNATRRFSFTASPAGTRWYHSHVAGGPRYQFGTYTGQFGIAIVEAAHEPGGYDLDVPILLHEWEPSLGKLDIGYRLQSINGKMLGAGEPVRVKAGQRVLFRIVNASATMAHRIALSGHSINVVALDGNPVATPRKVPVVDLGPAERADCIVEMNNPGVWVMGDTGDDARKAGMGIAIEYAGAKGAPQWLAPDDFTWDYTSFGDAAPGAASRPAPDAVIPLQIKSVGDEGWSINGKSWPKADPVMVKSGGRYRLVFDNQSSMAHPMHLHRHTFEVVKFAGKPTYGVLKDVVVVPEWKAVEVELVTRNPGLSLIHCHNQFHMDNGFMTLMQYA